MTCADMAGAEPDRRCENRGLGEDKGEQRTCVGVGVAETMRSAA